MGCGSIKKNKLEADEPILSPEKKSNLNNNSPSIKNYPLSKESQNKINEENSDSKKLTKEPKTNSSMNPNTVQKPLSFQERIVRTPWIYENFQISNIDNLGEGTYGKVFGTINLKSKKLVAIKYIFVQDEDEFNSMTKEINILSVLKQYGNIVHFEDKFIDSNSHEIFIAMERGSCDLTNYIKKNQNDLSFDIFLQIFADLSCGLMHAHKEKIIHSDIKPGNVLVFENQNRKDLRNSQNFYVTDENLVFKLTDWGAGCANSTGKTTRLKTDMAFTISYAAPELLIDEDHVNFEKGDIYSLGMTLLNCCGIKFKDLRHISSIVKEEKHDREIKELLDYVSTKYTDKISELLMKMLKFDRHKRIDLGEAIEMVKNIKNLKNVKTLEKKQTIIAATGTGMILKDNLWKTQGLEDNSGITSEIKEQELFNEIVNINKKN